MTYAAREAGEPLPNRTATEEVNDRKEYDCTQQRNQYRAHAEVAAHDVAATNHRIEDKSGDKGANNTDDYIKENPLLSVSSHDKAGYPSQDAANY